MKILVFLRTLGMTSICPFSRLREKHLIIVVLCFGLITSVCGAADQNLSFKEDNAGNFTFDTGVVKGALQKDGLGEGIMPIRFIDPDVPIDINHGLLVPYRFLTPQKRYGFGSWEWPRTGRTGQDGSAELHWDSANDRPFHFSTIYQWKAADTLDVAVVFSSGTNLEKFELFLGSYFRDFTKAKAYVKDAANGRPAFVEATKDKGDRQLFPRNSDVLSMVNDGRWKFPPYPLMWSMRGAMEAPLGMRQEPRSGATILFMASPDDCFAISMAEQEHKSGSFYLSLFGKDIKRGQTLVGHVRLVFGKNITEAQALQRYADYLDDLKNNADQTLISRAETVIPKNTSWISSEIPKPGADGWITLFDGQHLFGCDPTNQNFTSGKVFLNSGSLGMDDAQVRFDWKAHNTALRVRGKKVSGLNITLSIGPYRGWFNGKAVCFGIHQIINNRINDLAVKAASNLPDFFDMEMTVIGGKITLLANGVTVVTAQADPIKGDVSLNVVAHKGLSVFKRIEAKVLDD